MTNDYGIHVPFMVIHGFKFHRHVLTSVYPLSADYVTLIFVPNILNNHIKRQKHTHPAKLFGIYSGVEVGE